MAMAGIARPGIASLEDVRRLQQQMTQMQKSVDFIRLVECEASLQLMRMKNAQIMRPRRRGAEDEDTGGEQLETVKWLHFITDVVMDCVSSSKSTNAAGNSYAAPSPGFPDAGNTSNTPERESIATNQINGADSASSVSAAVMRRLDNWRSGGGGGGGGGGEMDAAGGNTALGTPLAKTTSHAVSFSSVQDTVPSRMPLVSPSTMTGGDAPPPSSGFGVFSGDALPACSHQVLGSEPDAALSRSINEPSAEQRSAPGAYLLHGRPQVQGSEQLFPRPEVPRGMPSTAVTLPTPGVCAPIRSTGGGYEASSMAMVGGPGGLVLGKGSWATAYRSAQGPRQESLKFLCMSGIVTARELSDDNTVISDEHIDECVLIASEMLQTRPFEAWARNSSEANKTFEARLTSLYERRFSEASGGPGGPGGQHG